DEHYFAWLPAVPQGDVDAAITLGGAPQHFTGIGYHDHNWGNISIVRLIDHWYWARGAIGPYTLIASYITVAQRYGYRTVPVFMLARGGRIVADDGSKVRFAARAIQPDPATGKPVANLTRYEYRDAGHHYVLTFTRRNTILRMKLVEGIHGIQGALARLIHFDGAFLRFTGDLHLVRYEGDQIVEAQQDEAIWELMYLAHAHAER
ncbi:MAG TPA: hydroxyneurosporene dehydrogenase, partial [Chloroflexia bacterium]